MVFNTHIIDVLKNGVKDIARSNMFEVVLNRPDFGNRSETLNVTQNLIKSVQIPQLLLGDIEIRRMGLSVFIPGNVTYTPVLVQFYDDVEGKTRSFVNDWINLYLKDVGVGSFNEDVRGFISGSLEIYQLDGKHNRMSKTLVKNAYPKMLGEIELNHDSEDTLNTFNATFSYTYALYSNNAPDFLDIDITPAEEIG